MKILLTRRHNAPAFWAAILLGVLASQFSPPAIADVTHYDINFNVTSRNSFFTLFNGSADQQGSFDYDSTTNSFSNFIVTWTINVTYAWNPGTLLIPPGTPQYNLYPLGTLLNVQDIYTFDFDQTSDGSTPQFSPVSATSGTWTAVDTITSFGQFNFNFPPTSTFAGTDFHKNLGLPVETPYVLNAGIGYLFEGVFESGTFSITPVPEPSIYLSLIVGIGLLGFMAQLGKRKPTNSFQQIT